MINHNQNSLQCRPQSLRYPCPAEPFRPLDKGYEGSGDEIEQSPENSSEIDIILHDLA